MSTYAKITDFAAKDALLTGNPSKIVKGTEIGAEFESIATADASNVKGPTSAVTNNALVRWDTTTGRLSKNSAVTVDDTGNITGTSFAGAHNGTVGATTPSTGAFTTLSASGRVSATGGGTAGGFNASANSYGDGTTVNYGAESGGNAWINTPTGKHAYVAVNNVTVTDVSSTGLSVTGALSSTGDVTVSGIAGTRTLNVQSNTSGDPTITLTAAGDNLTTIKQIRGSSRSRFTCGANYFDLIDGTGLAVTGALSANTTANQLQIYNSVGNAERMFATADVNGITFTSYNTALTPQPYIWKGYTTEWMRLDASGNLGLGVTPSASWSTVGRAIQIYGTGSISGYNTNEMDVGTNFYYAAGYKYLTTAAATNYMQSGGMHIWYTAPSGTAGTAITFTQSLAIGKGTTLALEGATSAAGTGIAFPATQLASSDANTLDDYEEGTWTPSVGGTATYTAQSGNYTKVGRVVTAHFDLTINAIGTGSTNIISGLPFTNSAAQCSGSLSYWSATATAVVALGPVVNPSGTTIQLYSTIAAAGSVAGGNNIFQNATRVIGTVTYYI